MQTDISQFEILNPKRNTFSNQNLYPYYAGFSPNFASTLIRSLELDRDQILLDPWNGSGTTTTEASKLGYASMGFDLNPVMVIVAKANLIGFNEHSSFLPLSQEIIQKAKTSKSNSIDDPLGQWLTKASCNYFRKIESSIHSLLINRSPPHLINTTILVQDLSTIASFYYVALFRTLRRVLSTFNTSNPTWIKVAKDSDNKVNPSLKEILRVFEGEVQKMLLVQKARLPNEWKVKDSMINIGSSVNIALNTNSVDFILTSPPYCTRIDYAIATLPELALLGYKKDDFESLRRSLIGSSTVPKKTPLINLNWGVTCNTFLNEVFIHPSKASTTYYFKNHLQYFDSIFSSIQQISRVLKPDGICTIIVQDSYYKDVYNNLAAVFCEMADFFNLQLIRKDDFKIGSNMVGINSASKKYRKNSTATESVLCFNQIKK